MMTFKPQVLTLSGLLAVTIAASAGAGSLYPEVTRAQSVHPIVRGCTQLEQSAGIDRAACGTLTLAQVAAIKAETESAKDDE